MSKSHSSICEAVLNTFDEAAIIWDQTGRVQLANNAACLQFGYSLSELSLLYSDSLHVDKQQERFTQLFQQLEDKGSVSGQIQVCFKNGSVEPFSIKASRIEWHDQIGMIAVYSPLSGEAGLQLLQESEERFRAITNSLQDAILIMDGKGLISFWNPAAESIFGYKEEEILGRNLHHLLAPERYHRVHDKAFKHFTKTGQGRAINRTLELEAVHRDGHEISIELSLSKYETIDQYHTIGIIRDITARKKSEEELRESEARFRALHNASFGGIAIHDFGVILDCNQGLSEMTGFSEDELIGMDGLFLIAPEWREMVRENIAAGFEASYEAEGLRKDGSNYPLYLRGSNIPYKGRQLRVTEFRDISEQKLLEAKLVQAQKMEAIGTLAGGIAHDFNNILAGILGYVDLSSKVTPESSPAGPFLKKALKGLSRAKDLVKQILAFSRLGESEMDIVELTPLVEEVVKLLLPSLPSNITIEQAVPADVMAVRADSTQLHQILMNLLTNAVHAMEEHGGVLSITLENTELSAMDVQGHIGLRPGFYVRISVRDTGPGIPAEVLERIFDPYFTTKSVGKGSGLGLAIVHGIIKNYGGHIAVESEPGKGAAFHVYLQASETIPEEVVEDSAPSPEGGTEHVLLVDDEEIVADMGKSILEHLGYRVSVFTNSDMALAAFRHKPFLYDLVMTDQTMPGITGEDLAKKILAVRADIPIIICTGYSSTMTEEKAEKLGIRGFAMKPLTLNDLSVIVRQVLDNSVDV